jgi:AraC-like DNA-binding protein
MRRVRSAKPVRDGGPDWDVALPSQPSRLPGVTMAGFSDRATDLVDLPVVPHPALTMVFNLGNASIVVDDGRGQQQRDRVVAGLAPIGVRAPIGRGFECLQVRLSPIVAHAVLRASSELGGAVVDLDELWGPDAARIQDQLHDAGSWDERFELADAELARRYDASRAVASEVAFAWRQMVASRGRVRVERLADEVGWSRKRLWSRFASQVGLTPKRAARLIRFDAAAHRLVAGHSAALVAAESGYVDQSHLHRDVMAFAGVTPAAIAASPFLEVDEVAWVPRP